MHALPLMQVRLTLRSAPNMYATFLIIFEKFFPTYTNKNPVPFLRFFTYLSFTLNEKMLNICTRLLDPTRLLGTLEYIPNLIVYDAKDDRLLGIYLSLVGGQAFNLSRLKIIYMLYTYMLCICTMG